LGIGLGQGLGIRVGEGVAGGAWCVVVVVAIVAIVVIVIVARGVAPGGLDRGSRQRQQKSRYHGENPWIFIAKFHGTPPVETQKSRHAATYC
jgi:hypothetical protein